MTENRWLLPQGIEEVLPAAAKRLENLRRELLDMYRSWGYELVLPPMIEYLESLLTHSGSDLDLQTFKITDQMTGRTMGIRADMTPQVARIESVALKREIPTRLCYLGTVLRTQPVELGGSRSPMQVGAELYGHAGPESDIEIITLLMTSLDTVGVKDVLLDIGHVGIFNGLLQDADLNEADRAQLFDIVQRKSVPELLEFLENSSLSSRTQSAIQALCGLNGRADILDEADKLLGGINDTVTKALATVRHVVNELSTRRPDLDIHLDLAELRGYQYHTGIVFAAYSIGRGKAIAQGGRYDHMEQTSDGSRPATGFSGDLKQWVRLSGQATADYKPSIMAPWSSDSDLQQKILELRAAGERVIYELNGEALPQDCDRQLVHQNNQWEVVPIS